MLVSRRGERKKKRGERKEERRTERKKSERKWRRSDGRPIRTDGDAPGTAVTGAGGDAFTAQTVREPKGKEESGLRTEGNGGRRVHGRGWTRAAELEGWPLRRGKVLV